MSETQRIAAEYVQSLGVVFTQKVTSKACLFPSENLPGELADVSESDLIKLARLTKAKRVSLHDAGSNELLKLCKPAWSFDLAHKLRQRLDCTLIRGKVSQSFDFYRHFERKEALPVTDLLYCVISDASAMDETFESWCSNYGYDSDNISALKTYNACIENGRKLVGIFSPNEINQLRELLQDY